MAITISGSGIVEANLADNAVTLDKMASGTDGQIITYDASGNPAAVGPGTDGQVLTSTGSTTPPAFEAVAAGGDLSFGGDTFGANKTIGSNDNYALSFETNATERLQLTNDGRGLSQFTAKAWCNFDGTGSAASWERDSHNVSSHTDIAAGHYTINFANNMANANYSAQISANLWSSSYPNRAIANTAVGGVTVFAQRNTSGAMIDTDIVCVLVFGD